MYVTGSVFPTPASSTDVTSNDIFLVVTSLLTNTTAGPCLSILFTFTVSSAIFPATSLTCTLTSPAFSAYVFVFSACQLFPPSKLYACSWSPLSLSCASTVNVIFWFVHSVLFPVTFIVGFVSSFTSFITVPLTLFPSVSLAYIVSPFNNPFTFVVVPVSPVFSTNVQLLFWSKLWPDFTTWYCMSYSELFVISALACLLLHVGSDIFNSSELNEPVDTVCCAFPTFPNLSAISTFI